MASLLRVCLFVLISSTALAQTPPKLQPQMPPGFDRIEFFGIVLARMSFCGMFHHVDQYEMAMAMKAFGVMQADRPAIEASRDKNYQIIRDKFKTARDHADFCIENRSWPFFIKAGRKGSPSWVGSDTEKQPEKIELFGNMLGALSFCKIPIDGTKWGMFLSDMGVKSESIKEMGEVATKKGLALVAEKNSEQAAACKEVRANPNFNRFSK